MCFGRGFGVHSADEQMMAMLQRGTAQPFQSTLQRTYFGGTTLPLGAKNNFYAFSLDSPGRGELLADPFAEEVLPPKPARAADDDEDEPPWPSWPASDPAVAPREDDLRRNWGLPTVQAALWAAGAPLMQTCCNIAQAMGGGGAGQELRGVCAQELRLGFGESPQAWAVAVRHFAVAWVYVLRNLALIFRHQGQQPPDVIGDLLFRVRDVLGEPGHPAAFDMAVEL